LDAKREDVALFQEMEATMGKPIQFGPKTCRLPLLLACLVGLAANPGSGYAQNVEESYLLPNKGLLRVLLVFVQEEEKSKCEQTDCNFNFPPDVLTVDAPKWFDPKHTYPPERIVTDYYWQASFGEYEVLGDYLPQVLTVPCNNAPTDTFYPTDQAIAIVDQITSQPGFKTANGLGKSDFDLWTLTSPGKPKIPSPDGKIDALVIVWRNHRQWGCTAGYGMQSWFGKNGNKVNAISSFSGGSDGGWAFLFLEYFHGLFGGNNWHNGGGAGAHTFLVIPKIFSTSGQSGSPSQIANAFDRQQMGWKDPGRTDLLAATDPTCTNDVPSDLDIKNFPSGGEFCLRDYNLTGDAIRIKLPHLDWNPPLQPIKNQYLFLENHRLDKSLTPYKHNADLYGGLVYGNRCEQPGVPGLYAYIQVGKDVKTGPGIYSTSYSHPNGLGSWLHPLEAEGRWDYIWRYDKLQAADPGLGCNWGNANIPEDPWNAQTLPNPFTGLSDLVLTLDSNKDGVLLNGDSTQGGLSEILRDGTIQHNWYNHGDSGDSYRTGYRTRIALDTNPAPVPLYTYTQNPFNLTPAGKPQAYENRRIFLNGLSIDILGEDPDGNQRVKVQWDDYTLHNDVRWTGDIVLRNDPNDPMNRPSRLVVTAGSILDLDQGLSPTQHKSIGKLADGSWLFAAPTALTLEAGTKTRVNNNGQILVRNGSTLHVKSGAQLALFGQGSLTIDAGSYLCIEPGANIILSGAASRLRINAGATIGLNPGLGFPSTTCQPATAIAKTGPGVVIPSQGCFDPKGADVVSTRAFFPFDNQPGTGIATDLANGYDLQELLNPVACPGIVNGALCFDGLTSYARSAESTGPDLGTKDFSIAAWIRTNDVIGTPVILSQRTYHPLAEFPGYSLFLYNGRPALLMATAIITNWTSDQEIADGKWHHLVVTVDRDGPNGGRFYVDCNPVLVAGQPAFNPTGHNGSLGNPSPLYVARSAVPFEGGFWSGAIDELSLYSKVLSPAEVQALCHTAGVGRCQAPF
jgi:hypothetical protein